MALYFRESAVESIRRIFRQVSDTCQRCIDLVRAKSEALFNIFRFLKENVKSSNTKDKLKATRTVKTTTIELISKKKNNFAHAAQFFFLIRK